MTTLAFVGLVEGAQPAAYTIRFPDMPDVTAQGRDLGELVAEARQAIRQELQRRTDQGLDWPAQTPLESVSPAAGALPLIVDVTVEDTAVRVNLSIGEHLLKRIDDAAEARNMSRSGFIAMAARAALGERTSPLGAAEFEATAQRLQAEWTSLSQKLSESLGPNSAFQRNLSDLDGRLSDSIRRAADSVSAAMAKRRDAEAAAAARTGSAAASDAPQASAV